MRSRIFTSLVLVVASTTAAVSQPSAQSEDASAPKPQEQDADSDVELTIDERALLDAALAAGETIEITGGAAIETVAPGTADVRRDELHTMAGARGDAISAVRNLPGVANADARDGAGVLSIRGTSGEDSLIMIDGVQIPLAMHFGNVQSVIPTEMIERIELTPGGFDVEHGRATGGVLSIETRSTYPTDWTGFAEFSFINVGGFVEGPLLPDNKLSMSLSFRRSIVDALLPIIIPDDANVSFRTPPRYYDGQLKLNWTPSARHELSLLVLGSDDRVGLAVDSVDPLDPVVTGDIRGRAAFWRGLLRWNYQQGDVVNKAIVSVGDDLVEQYLNGRQFFFRVNPRTFYARNAFAWKQAQRFRLRVGGDVEIGRGEVAAHITLPGGEGADSPILAGDPLVNYDEPVKEHRYALWIATDFEPIKGLSVTPGIRADRLDHHDATVIQPRLALAASASPRLTVRAAIGMHARPLAFAEQLRADLKPERALHLTGGLDLKLADGFTATATGFVTEMSDMVVRDNDFMGEDALDAYSNSGRGRVVGGELLVRYARSRLSGWLAYTISKSTRTDGPSEASRLFDLDQPHNLVAVGSYKLGRWRFGGRFRLASGTPWTPVMGAVYVSDKNFYRPIHGERNSERTELDHQLDLRVDRHLVLGGVDLDAFIDVSNVYSHPKHIDHEYSFDYNERRNVTDIPIFPSLGLRGTF